MLAHGMCKKFELHLYRRVSREVYLISAFARKDGKLSERFDGTSLFIAES
jgi:hypothetical protein